MALTVVLLRGGETVGAGGDVRVGKATSLKTTANLPLTCWFSGMEMLQDVPGAQEAELAGGTASLGARLSCQS